MHGQEGGDSAWERRHSYIIAHYARTWLFIDVIATIPFDIITESADVYGTEVLQAVRIVRLLKLLRVARAARVFSRWQTKIALPYSKQARRDRAEITPSVHNRHAFRIAVDPDLHRVLPLPMPLHGVPLAPRRPHGARPRPHQLDQL